MDDEMRATARPQERGWDGVRLIGLGCGLLATLLLLVLLVGGAFVAGQLVENGQIVMPFSGLFERPEELPGEGGQAEEGTVPTIAASTATPAPTPSPRLHIGEGGIEETVGPPEQPEELPDEPPEVYGVCVRREGNNLFVGTGSYSITIGPGGATEVNYDGPEVEVAVTSETEIYAERVELPQRATAPQHIVEPGSLDDVVQGTGVRVWGEQDGDRIVAHVVVYQAMAGRIEQP
ncbi:MAG: hypothetical protein U9R72_05345 [Chloroflexota bacterium]|nr:hypothetical protein [Chloroflexota bacterium]